MGSVLAAAGVFVSRFASGQELGEGADLVFEVLDATNEQLDCRLVPAALFELAQDPCRASRSAAEVITTLLPLLPRIGVDVFTVRLVHVEMVAARTRHTESVERVQNDAAHEGLAGCEAPVVADALLDAWV